MRETAARLWLEDDLRMLAHVVWTQRNGSCNLLPEFIDRCLDIQSRPSRPLLITTMLVVAVGALLPFTGLAGPLGFVPLTGTFYVFVAVATLVYLVLVQPAKAVLLAHVRGWRVDRISQLSGASPKLSA